VDQDLDGCDPTDTEGTEQVAGRICVKPLDGVSFIDHDEGLPINQMINTLGSEQMFYTTRPDLIREEQTETLDDL
jgi:hypothetical protein